MGKKQTSIYFSENDFKKLDKLKEVYEIDSNGEMLRELVRQEYTTLLKYESLNLNK